MSADIVSMFKELESAWPHGGDAWVFIADGVLYLATSDGGVSLPGIAAGAPRPAAKA